MEGKENNYLRIQHRLFVGFGLILILFVATGLASVEAFLTPLIGEQNFHVLKLVPWGGFGALMRAAYLSATDKVENYKRKMLLERAEGKIEDGPDYPDENDVEMYMFYIFTGCVMGALSAYIVHAGVAYVDGDLGIAPAISEKYPLFVIFAFYAGYRQSDFIKQLQSKAKQI